MGYGLRRIAFYFYDGGILHLRNSLTQETSAKGNGFGAPMSVTEHALPSDGALAVKRIDGLTLSTILPKRCPIRLRASSEAFYRARSGKAQMRLRSRCNTAVV
ncbi:hypothetical protein NDU88_004817 [Pleurodeles waltl]|uniref:Uncharacterized protein n=1 Tax=Pleurodeles waltl TaxID=8319 RepID=A0AAV7T8J2_PLEWA|nr:hypothetical protein NDU88_004817 [Pleurodeles waltl]